jgi:hypothetical protein
MVANDDYLKHLVKYVNEDEVRRWLMENGSDSDRLSRSAIVYPLQHYGRPTTRGPKACVHRESGQLVVHDTRYFDRWERGIFKRARGAYAND